MWELADSRDQDDPNGPLENLDIVSAYHIEHYYYVGQ
jgi:hypothetical protein